jgi:hypothetical protein
MADYSYSAYYLFAYQAGDADYSWPDPYLRIPPEAGQRPRPYVVSKYMPVPMIVDTLVALAKSYREKIEVLCLCAHGWTGRLFLGDTDGKGIDPNMVWEHFRRLRPYLDGGAIIKVYGCAIASDRPPECKKRRVPEGELLTCKPGTFDTRGGITDRNVGFWWLKAMANATGVRVQGAVNVQSTWVPKKADPIHFLFKGPTLLVLPDLLDEDGHVKKIRGYDLLDYSQEGNVVRRRRYDGQGNLLGEATTRADSALGRVIKEAQHSIDRAVENGRKAILPNSIFYDKDAGWVIPSK